MRELEIELIETSPGEFGEARKTRKDWRDELLLGFLAIAAGITVTLAMGY